MRNLVIGLVIFSILINFSTGIMMDAVPAFQGMDARIGISDNEIREDYTYERIEDEFGNPVQGYPTVQDSTSINQNTLMDRVGLGAISKLTGIINKYMFGFIDVLKALFGTGVPAYVFVAMKYMLTLIYSFVAIELFTGKRLME